MYIPYKPRHEKDNPKALISCVFTAQMNFVLVLFFVKSRFSRVAANVQKFFLIFVFLKSVCSFC